MKLSIHRRIAGSRSSRNRFFMASILLIGMLLTGCDKLADKLGLHGKSKTTTTTTTTGTNTSSAPPGIIIASANVINTNLTSMDLGTIMLTNHQETIISLGTGTNCRVTPLLLNKNSVQLTLTVETRNTQGKMQDLSITQVTAQPDQHYEANVGEFTFSFIPKVVSE